MECYVITMKEVHGGIPRTFESNVLGVFENKADVFNLLMKYYTENEGKFEKQSLNQFENSTGVWTIELVGEKGLDTITIKGERATDAQVTSLKQLI